MSLQNTKYQIQNTNRGITLVALIITVIILLILATVSIRLVINGGIIDRAERGTQAYSDAEIEEQIKLAYSEYQTAKWTSETKSAQEFMEASLKEKLKDESLTVKVKNEKFTVNTSVKGENKTYIFKSSSGKAYEYQDPFDYGEYTKENIPKGKDITLGTEKFRVFYNKDGTIKAMPHYNLVTIIADGTVKQGPEVEGTSTEISSKFSTTNYWIEGTDEINMDDSKNLIQQYITAYETTLEGLGADGITVRAGKYSELSASGVSNAMRNPGGANNYWVGSSVSGHPKCPWVLRKDGALGYGASYWDKSCVRPIIIIEY